MRSPNRPAETVAAHHKEERTWNTFTLVSKFPSIPPENLTEFKAKTSEALEIVADEEGTHRYDWFFNEDGTRCVVMETYSDSDAMLGHVGNVGHLLEPLVGLAGGNLEVDVFGDPSPELLEAAAAFEPTVHTLFGSE